MSKEFGFLTMEQEREELHRLRRRLFELRGALEQIRHIYANCRPMRVAFDEMDATAQRVLRTTEVAVDAARSQTASEEPEAIELLRRFVREYGRCDPEDDTEVADTFYAAAVNHLASHDLAALASRSSSTASGSEP